jgi:endonuclease III
MTARKRPAAAKPRPSAPAKPAKAAVPAKGGSKGDKPAAKAPAAKPASKESAAKPASKDDKAKATKPVPAAPEPKPVPEKVPPRGQLLPKLHKALKSQYKPFAANTSRDLLDQVLLACCLENTPADVAEKAFARLKQAYADPNEVRVTTVAELAETLHDLPDPTRAALSLRRALQGVFESTYTFSLDHARKHSLAHGLKVLEGLHGVPPFVVQYVASTALGGHLIPLDKGALAGLWLCGLITKHEYDSGKVPGLERLIGKKAGVEFSALLHQFGIDVLTNLHGNTVRKVVQAVNPAAKDRFPKRGEQVPEPVPPIVTDKAAIKAADAARAAAEELRPAGPQAAARPAGKTPLPPPGSGPKKPGDGKGKSGPKPFVVKPLSIKPPAAPPPAPEQPKAAAPAKPKVPAPPAKPKPNDKHSAQLSKRKPR